MSGGTMIEDARLLTALSELTGTVLVVGDVMLDVFAYGQAERISPEAPVPVMRLERELWMPGGAGNVARNIAALGGRAILIGLVGEDASGTALASLTAAEVGIESRLLRVARRQTTVKQRFVVGSQQMLRVDREVVRDLDSEEEAALIAEVTAAVSEADAVVLSDYGKGALSAGVVAAAITAARARGVPVLVDPKHPDSRRYAGATTVTPNAGELARATGLPVADDDAVEAAARAMMAACGAAYLVVTRSAQGLSYVPADGVALHIPARRREVFDVSGAGDTVVGMLALALASGLAPLVSAALANLAAGVVVAKPGTATCSLDEIEIGLIEASLRLGDKLQLAPRARRLVEQWRAAGLRVGFTNGCFDLLHPGHVTLLAQARARCDRLVLGLNSDASVRRLKGASRPLQTQAARAAVLAALASVDCVVIFDEDTPLALIEQLCPDLLFKGADYTLDTVVGAEVVRGYGGRIELIDLVAGHSTTRLVERMR
ncbi:MAG TPA: D-glycero-beta-D-manno-heptose-7-phosphate kinase [Methylorubrum populi]|uniref:Bifunctional protein HldE n=1 Tax=Methylorubrum populi TaxID=223967 RepID=A0A921JEQ6_9HYPH|nr:D-glycero-beta-D-manno-heptose-7-phosphate kinase [Methylorubrum populi]